MKLNTIFMTIFTILFKYALRHHVNASRKKYYYYVNKQKKPHQTTTKTRQSLDMDWNEMWDGKSQEIRVNSIVSLRCRNQLPTANTVGTISQFPSLGITSSHPISSIFSHSSIGSAHMHMGLSLLLCLV